MKRVRFHSVMNRSLILEQILVLRSDVLKELGFG